MKDFMKTMNNKKKFMLISPTLCQGGFERICVTTARLLTPHFDVIIVLFDSGNIAFDVTGLNIIDIKQGVKKGKIAKFFNIIIRAKKVRKLKKIHNPIVAYSFGATANIVNALSKTKESKAWLSLHSYMDMGEEAKLRLFMRKADTLLCCSKFIADELKERFSYEKAITLYNPYDVKEMKRLAESAEPRGQSWDDSGEELIHLMSMGREDDVKGFWHTVKVFYLIQQKISNVRLTILGEGLFTEYKKLASDLGIAEKVYFTGMQKNPYKYLKSGTIYLLNSLMEGFPNALIEAMAMGMVPVACDCRSGPAEILLDDVLNEAVRDRVYQDESALWGDYGILIKPMNEPKNVDANVITAGERIMAEIVIKMLSSADLLQKYKDAATRRALVFTGEAYLKHIFELLESKENG